MNSSPVKEEGSHRRRHSISKNTKSCSKRDCSSLSRDKTEKNTKRSDERRTRRITSSSFNEKEEEQEEEQEAKGSSSLYRTSVPHLHWAAFIKSHHHVLQARWSNGWPSGTPLLSERREEGFGPLGMKSMKRLRAVESTHSTMASGCSTESPLELEPRSFAAIPHAQQPVSTEQGGSTDIMLIGSSTHNSSSCDREEAENPLAALKAWTALLDHPEQRRQRVAYATAMHHLATQYWDPPLEKGEAIFPQVNGLPTPQQRREEVEMSSASSIPTPSHRRYDDRVQLCLECLHSYFIGTPAPLPSFRKDEDQKEEFVPNEAEYGMERLFTQPPLIVAQHSKTMRRSFFQAHQRMATPREVEHLLWGVPLLNSTASASGLVEDEISRTDTVICPFPTWCSSCRTDRRSPAHAPVRSTSLTTAAVKGGEEGIFSWGSGMDQTLSYVALLQAVRQQYLQCLHGRTEERNKETFLALPPSPTPLHVLDVGSCYGPFEGTFVPFLSIAADGKRPHLPPEECSLTGFASVPLDVVSLDLEPYQAKVMGPDGWRYEVPSVLQADWLTAKVVFPSQPFTSSLCKEGDGDLPTAKEEETPGGTVERASLPKRRVLGEGRVEAILTDVPVVDESVSLSPLEEGVAEEEGAGCAVTTSTWGYTTPPVRRQYQLSRLAAESFDVVIFCLLLSYLPSPQLRYQACLQAYLVLKERGLLVVLSTRTQGSRRGQWVEQWIQVISRIGFERIHVQTREKVVVLSFQKRSAPEGWLHSAGEKECVRTPPSEEQVEAWRSRMLSSDDARQGLQIMADQQI